MSAAGLLQSGAVETLHGVWEAVSAYWKTAPTVVRVSVGLVVVAVGVYLSKLLVRLLGRPVARRFRRQSVAQTVLAAIRITTVLVFTALAAGVVGFRLGDIVLSVTVFSAVLGIVLAPIVGSIINGLFVLADQPYEIGDMVELGDTRGFVDDITLRYTKIFTLDNTFIVLSNSSIREREVTNFSAEDERTRLSLRLLVTYECDVGQARELLERAARDCEGVIEGGPDIRIGSGRYPAKPTCLVEEYADHGVLLNLRFWTRTPYKIARIRSSVQEQVWALFDDADVEIAYPHQQLVFDETSGQAQVAVESSPASWARRETDGNAE
ncbi:mechanosensitive ion channel family protein [Salinirarus marinus]|uniref:mechanosensitive ion channel family protein n=1 Tax=Salinirarus marinus TaxID=3068310 RepID=UPI003C6C9D2B